MKRGDSRTASDAVGVARYFCHWPAIFQIPRAPLIELCGRDESSRGRRAR